MLILLLYLGVPFQQAVPSAAAFYVILILMTGVAV